MRRGTTPTFTVDVDDDISRLEIFLTFKAGRIAFTKTGNDLDVSTTVIDGKTHTVIGVALTQLDTLRMHDGDDCEVQLRACDGPSTVLATNIGTVPVERILYNRMIGGE